MRFYLKKQEVNNQKTFFLKKSLGNLVLVSGEFKYRAGNVSGRPYMTVPATEIFRKWKFSSLKHYTYRPV